MNSNIKEKITKDISENEICLFMKGTPDALSVVFQWQSRIF